MLRRKPIERYAEPKRRMKLKQRSSSARAKGLEAWRRQEANAVHGRVRCQVPWCREPGTDPHHPYGRTSEPWGSSRLVLVLLCRQHHQAVTGQVGSGLDVKLRDELRWLALEQVRQHVNKVRTEQGTRHTLTWTDDEEEGLPRRFAYVVSVAEANGIEPPFFGSDRRKK